jgi:hypothetical protein
LLRVLSLVWMGGLLLAASRADPAVLEDEIKWTRASKLKWDDFRARPDRTSRMDALTESGISFAWGCDRSGFSFEAYALFVPGGSWVREPTDALLRHEQAHFDITEIHARKLRKYFGGLADPCGLGKQGIEAAAQGIIAANHAMQAEYDAATDHGRDLSVQRAWLDRIAEELAALEPWAE